jgi:5-oxoprolinase (ATP-hydrolysing) subunit A
MLRWPFKRVIDLNLDAGESPQSLRDGGEAALFGVVSSVNIACGGHAGDEASMRQAVRLAIGAGVRIGAHPSFPDRENFGRKSMAISRNDLVDALVAQIKALAAICREESAELSHVKPHGALYNLSASNREMADAVFAAVKAVNPVLTVVGLAGSPMTGWAGEMGLKAIGEAFADRRYEDDGSLRDRRHADALIQDPKVAAGQAVSIARKGQVTAVSGKSVPVGAGTICIHGDSPGALEMAKEVRHALESAGVKIGNR